MLIVPLIGAIASFIVVWSVAMGLRREADFRKLEAPGDGMWMGFAMSAFLIIGSLPVVVEREALALVVGIPAIVFWILWWRWAAKSRARIEKAGAGRQKGRRWPSVTL